MRHGWWMVLTVLSLGMTTSLAMGAPNPQAGTPVAAADEGPTSRDRPAPEIDVASVKRPKLRFGEADSLRLNLLAGYANDFDDAQQGQAGLGLSWFFIDDVSLDLELLGFGTEQPGTDVGGVNFNVLFRWHFLARETWSIYVDGGAGVLFASNDIPSGGTEVNFTPQVGVGASFDVFDDARLMVGARWYHISNGRTSRQNPGRDSLLFYVGLSFGF